MTATNLAALAILPIAMWAIVIFMFVPANRVARRLRESWVANTKEEAVEGARAWAVVGLLVHIVVLAITVLLVGSQNQHAGQILRNEPHVFQLSIQGLMFGLALGILVPLTRLLLPESRRFRLTTLVTIGPSLPTSFLMLIMLIFVHELWRVLCLQSLIQAGCAPQFAVLLTSIACGLAFSMSGLSAGASAAALGVIYSAIYLWQGYFLLPFVAHLTYEAQIIILSWASPATARPPLVASTPLAKCPACRVRFDLRRVRSGVTVQCPRCAAKLSVSDDRTALIRWGGVIFTTLLIYVAFSAFEATLGSNESTLWIAYALALPAYWSLVLTLRVLFPPKLQFGDPSFIGLNLGPQLPRNAQAPPKPDEPPGGTET